MRNIDQGLSIIIPCRDESGSLPGLINELNSAISAFQNIPVEVIWVNDASKDESQTIFGQLGAPHKIIENRIRLGQSASIQKAYEISKYSHIGIIDGDGQNSPFDLFSMYQMLQENLTIDFMQGRRIKRKDKLISRKIPSSVANFLARKLLKTKIHDLGCATKVIKRDVIEEIPFAGEIHRIYPAHAEIIGFNVKELPVEHRPRISGETKYGLNRFFKFFIDILFARFRFAVASKPTYVFGGISIVFLLISLSMFLLAFILRILDIKDYLDGALIVGSIVIFMAGILTAFQAVVIEVILQATRNK